MELLSGINKNGTAILPVTHDTKVAARANRVLFMKDGAIKSKLQFDKFNGKDLENRTEKVMAQMKNLIYRIIV